MRFLSSLRGTFINIISFKKLLKKNQAEEEQHIYWHEGKSQ